MSEFKNNDNNKVNTSTEVLGDLGTLKGSVYTPELKTVANIKLILGEYGETVTDENGCFEFIDVPVGKYELYTVLEDGTKYIFREISIEKDVELSVKLKYDTESNIEVNDNPPEEENNTWVWVIVAIVASVLLIGGLFAIIVVLKKKRLL